MDQLPDELHDAMLDEVESRHGLPHDQNAREYERRAADLAPGEPGRAAWLAYAGEAWELAGDLGQARRCYEEAVADGGDGFIDPRAELLGVLLEVGENDRADDLLGELRQAVREGQTGGFVHDTVGEALEMHGHPEEALRWFDAGLTRSERETPGEPDQLCLNGHFRVRRALGLPYDRYDELAEAHRSEYLEEIADEERLLDAPGGAQPARLAVLYWPPEEFARLVERWPAITDDYGEDHHEHRAIVERHLRQVSQDHHPGVFVAAGSFDDYLVWAQDRGEQAHAASIRASYAAHLGHLDETVTPWPPGRNDRCWCGSGSKYKKCCGALRFAETETGPG